MGVWDADEFFQPRGKYTNILDILNDMEAPEGPIRNTNLKHANPLIVYKKGYKPQRGMADADGHPFCYLLLNSEVTLADTVLPDADLVRTMYHYLCNRTGRHSLPLSHAHTCTHVPHASYADAYAQIPIWWLLLS